MQNLLTELIQALNQTLPGEKAQQLMSSYPRVQSNTITHKKDTPVNSATLLLLIPQTTDWVIPFIKRTTTDKYHGGQIALPGGKQEKSDPDIQTTARRECQEEIGIPMNKISLLGQLSNLYIPFSNFNVTPFVGTIPEIPNFVRSQNEVEKILLVPLKKLMDDTNKNTQILHIHDQEIIAPGYHINGDFIWGATAMIIAELEYIIKQELKLHIQ